MRRAATAVWRDGWDCQKHIPATPLWVLIAGALRWLILATPLWVLRRRRLLSLLYREGLTAGPPVGVGDVDVGAVEFGGGTAADVCEGAVEFHFEYGEHMLYAGGAVVG